MSKTFWAILAIIVVIFGGILVFNNKDSSKQASSSAKPTEHVMGSGSTGLTLVEYGDYQCPYCAEFHPGVKETAEKYKSQIRFQFRNLPLSTLHKNAFAAARAAEAADMQGKFWEMHDALYENQKTWSESDNAKAIFDTYASRLGMNVNKFNQDMASDKVNDSINADIAAYDKTGFEKSTPTFILNGKKVQPTGFTVGDFSKILDPAIAAKQKS